jgi:hypothetical protein
MENSKEKQFTDMMANIKEMRRMMDASAPAFRHIYLARNLRLLFLVGGCWVLIFSLAYHVLLMIYNNHILIPENVKTIFFSLFFLSLLMLIGLRTHLTLKAGRKLDKKLDLWGLTKLVLSSRIWLSVIPVLIVLFILPYKIFPYWPNNFYVPYIAIVYGTILNMIGVGIRVREYSISGYWLIGSGLIGLFFIVMPFHIAFAVNFAPAFFLFAIIAYISGKRVKYGEK